MKKLSFVSLFLFFASCSSVKQVANDVYQVKCHSVVGNCQELMRETCNGREFQVTNKDWSYGLGGVSDVVSFQCKNVD